jgi:YD repeat-containing protein
LTNEVRYVWDGMAVLQERDGSDAVKVTYTRGLDLSGTMQGAGGIGGLLARTDSSATTFYHSDGGGNITTMTDSSGNVVARYLYDPYGNLLAKSGAMADVNKYRFSSKEGKRHT